MPLSFKLHHIAVQTGSLEKALNFYRDTLGLSVLKEETSRKGRKIVWLAAGETRIELYSGKPGQALPDGWNENGLGPLSLGFFVENLKEAVTHLTLQGIRVIREPYEPVPGERAAMIEGPDGEEIVLVEKAATASGR